MTKASEEALDTLALRVELARRGMTQFALAKRLRCPPSTLSCWIRGAAPMPNDLRTRIEHALGLQAGTLAPSNQ